MPPSSPPQRPTRISPFQSFATPNEVRERILADTHCFHPTSANIVDKGCWRTTSNGPQVFMIDSEPLIFRGVWMVEGTNFFLTADGSFKMGSDSFKQKFCNTKGSCFLRPVIGISGFEWALGDNQKILQTIELLEKKALLSAKPQVTSIVQRVASSDNACHAIKLTHSMFLPTEEADEDVFCLLKNWPVSKDLVKDRDALCEAGTHVANALPAFDVYGLGIKPDQYRQKLVGAVIDVQFYLRHWWYGSSNKSIFHAVPQEIIVIRPPPDSSPRKRKMADGPASPALSTPSKKATRR